MPSDKRHGDSTAFKPGDILSTTTGLQVTIQWHMDTLHALFADPAVSDWLKRALRDLAQRDPLNALHDIELLQALMQDRLEACLRAASAGEPQDGCSR